MCKPAPSWRLYLFRVVVLPTAATLLALALTSSLFQDKSVPLNWVLDGKEAAMSIRNILQGDATQRIAAPFGYDCRYPLWIEAVRLITSPIDTTLVKAIGFFEEDLFRVINYYFILTFILISITFVYVHDRIGFPVWASLPFALVYSFLPYHLSRGMTHWRENYYLVPLMGLILIWSWSAKPVFFKRVDGRWKFHCLDRKALVAFLVSFLLIKPDYYHAFFFVILLLGAAAHVAVYKRSIPHMLSPLIVILFVLAALAKPLIPGLLMQLFYPEAHRHQIIARADVSSPMSIVSYGDAEAHGLKIVQMLLPHEFHRLDELRAVTALYQKHNPLIGENSTTSLGLFGGIGLIFITSAFVFRRGLQLNLPGKYGFLAMTCILTGTIGGLGSLFISYVYTAMNWWPELQGLLIDLSRVRCFNRIFVFITFFSLSGVALIYRHFIKHYFQRIKSMPIRLFGLLILSSATSAVGVWEATPAGRYGARQEYLPGFYSDREFFYRVEKSLPAGAMVFQLPFRIHHRTASNPHASYSDFYAGYVLTDSLRWSFGANEGSGQLIWYEYTAAAWLGDMLNEIARKGFSAVLIDRNWYEDRASGLEEQLKKALKREPVTSNDGRYALFALFPVQP